MFSGVILISPQLRMINKKIPSLILFKKGIRGHITTNQTQTMGDEGLEPPLKGL